MLALPLAPKSREIRVWRSDAVFCLMSVRGVVLMTRGAALTMITRLGELGSATQQPFVLPVSVSREEDTQSQHQSQPNYISTTSTSPHIFCALFVCVNKRSIFKENKKHIFATSWLDILLGVPVCHSESRACQARQLVHHDPILPSPQPEWLEYS